MIKAGTRVKVDGYRLGTVRKEWVSLEGKITHYWVRFDENLGREILVEAKDIQEVKND